uniref:Uncharacterized protein n=1 Tax=Micrurus spixii TaxID=129469 RepID=A0A2D4M2J5_9SAUR
MDLSCPIGLLKPGNVFPSHTECQRRLAMSRKVAIPSLLTTEFARGAFKCPVVAKDLRLLYNLFIAKHRFPFGQPMAILKPRRLGWYNGSDRSGGWIFISLRIIGSGLGQNGSFRGVGDKMEPLGLYPFLKQCFSTLDSWEMGEVQLPEFPSQPAGWGILAVEIQPSSSSQ